MQTIAAVIVETYPRKALPLLAIRRALQFPRITRLYTLADEPFIPGAVFHRIPVIRSLNEYSDLVMRVLPELIEEDFALLIQWDGMPVFADRWDEGFLAFDYIGAPWHGMPEHLAVGNGGFSLRSRRFLDLVRRTGIGIDPHNSADQPEDLILCRENRAQLEQAGARFAPVSVAGRFSFESGVPSRDVFGFHSTYNFLFYLPENELLGFAEEIVHRQTNVLILNLYLLNLLRSRMFDLFRLSVQAILAKPALAGALRSVIIRNPDSAEATFIQQAFS